MAGTGGAGCVVITDAAITERGRCRGEGRDRGRERVYAWCVFWRPVRP